MKKQPDAPKRKPAGKTVSPPTKVTIHKLPTGVRGLDDIMGGGIPEFSFNIIAGTPGCGKTTMAHQLRTGPRQSQGEEAAPEPKAKR